MPSLYCLGIDFCCQAQLFPFSCHPIGIIKFMQSMNSLKFILFSSQCKNVISKLQRRIQKEGNQLVPFLSEWWRRNENSIFVSPGATSSNLLDLKRIEQRVDNSEYNDVMDFIADLQLMLKNIVRHCNYLCEVRLLCFQFRLCVSCSATAEF